MSKGIFTLILVIIIAFSLTVIPQNGNLIDFGFIDDLLSRDDEPDVEEPQDTFVPEYEVTASRADNDGTDSLLYEILIVSNEADRAKSPDFTVNLYRQDTLVGSYLPEDVLIDSADQSDQAYNRLKLVLDLSQRNLEVAPGMYTAEIQITDGDYKPVSRLELNYIESFDYVGASDTTPSGSMVLELYFLDQTYNYLIPVSRTVPATDKLIRETINNQFEGPNSASGLQDGPIGPWSYSAHVGAGNVLEMNFHPADLTPYGIGSSAAMFAVDSIVYSMTAISYVDKVMFLVEDEPAGADYLHGMDLFDPVGRLDWPNIYLAHESATEKVFLHGMTPYGLLAEDIFLLSQGDTATLTQYGLDYLPRNQQVIFPVPAKAVLNGFSVSGSTATLDLGRDGLETAYGDMSINYEMMVDALVYSYTSFDSISRVQVLIDGEALDDFHGLDLSQPLTAKAYINLEP